MRSLIAGVAVLFAASFASAGIVDMPLDTLSPAGYVTTPPFVNVGVETEGPRTFIKVTSLNGQGSTIQAPKIDFEIFTGSTVDATASGATLDFDIRYFQTGNGENGEQPYDDTHSKLDVLLYSSNNEVYTWTDAFNNPQPFGEWHTLSLDLSDTAGNAAFDLSQVSYMELRGFNNRFVGADHISLDNLTITPEPGTAALLALVSIGICRRRRVSK